MKKRILSMAAIALAFSFTFAACDDDDDEPEEVVLSTYGGADLAISNGNEIMTVQDTTGYSVMGIDWTSFSASQSALLSTHSVELYNYFNKADGSFYGGFAWASFKNSEEYSYYLAPASGSAKSGSTYVIGNPGTICKTMMRKGLTSYLQKDKIDHVYIQNMTLVADAIENGSEDFGLSAFVQGDYLRVKATGYKLTISDGLSFSRLWDGIKDLKTSTGSSTFTLAEYTSAGLTMVNEWTKWDLTDLGAADVIIFDMEGKVGSTSTGSNVNPLADYWKYFVIDDITLLTD